MKAGVTCERFPGERRVALVPATIPVLKKAGVDVIVESGAGSPAGFLDAAYQEKGARIVSSRADVFNDADVVLQVRTAGAAGAQGRDDLPLFRPQQTVVGMADPLGAP